MFSFFDNNVDVLVRDPVACVNCALTDLTVCVAAAKLLPSNHQFQPETGTKYGQYLSIFIHHLVVIVSILLMWRWFTVEITLN